MLSLSAYQILRSPGSNPRIWTGIFGAPSVPAVRFFRDDQELSVSWVSPLEEALTDEMTADAAPSVWFAVAELTEISNGRIVVRAESSSQSQEMELVIRDENPHGLRILIASCYSHDEDGRDGGTRLADVIHQLPFNKRPDVTVLMGDQVYLDLPLNQNLKGGISRLSERFQREYVKNWFSLGGSGLRELLQLAPVVCAPDDHEYWNNYPESQAHIPLTWSQNGRNNWEGVARRLWTAFQSPAKTLGDTTRFDHSSFSLLVLDMRSAREKGANRLLSDSARNQYLQWASDVRNDRKVGLLVTGQSLFQEPKKKLDGRWTDWHLANYQTDYRLIMSELQRCADSGKPVVCITGDVHWGRVLHAVSKNATSVSAPILEVVSSPSSLLSHTLKDVQGKISSWIGRSDGEWPRHSSPPRDDEAGYPQELLRTRDIRRLYPHKGNQFAILSLQSSGQGRVHLAVEFYSVRSPLPAPAEVHYPLVIH